MNENNKNVLLLVTHNKKKIINLKEGLIKLINSAKKNIYLSTWLLNLKDVKDALLKKASELKGHIYCLMAIEQNNFRYKLSPAYKNSLEADIDETQERFNFKCLKELSGSNSSGAAIEIRGHSNCHAKFLVIDEEKMLITSANFTHASLEIGPNPILNRNEIGLLICDSYLVRELTCLFKDIYLLRYNAHYPFKGPEKDEFYPVVYSKQILHNNNDYLSELIDSNMRPSNGLELIWTYDILNEKEYPKGFEPKKFLKALEEIIKIENQFIFITAFSIVDLEDTLSDLLIKKIQDQKVKTVIIIDTKNKDRVPEKLKKLTELDNFDIFYHPGTHAKFVLTSKNWLMATANIDGTHGLRNSFEVGILGGVSEIYAIFKDFFIELLSECPNSQECLLKIKTMNQLTCKLCGSKFNTKNGLNHHLNSFHHQTKTKQSLNLHIKAKH